MKCPKCNKEVSPDWKLCPFCGFEPKRCSNSGCSPRWLPQDAKFCPECGKMLEETNIVPIPRDKEENRSVSVGDILCTDGTTMPVSEWPTVGKNAMGVVFYVDHGGQHGWAVNLRDLGERVWTPFGKEREVYGLRKFDTIGAALSDEDGFTNTKTLRAEGDPSEYPAAFAMVFSEGWYLPAAGQLKVLMNRRETVNATLIRLHDGDIIENHSFYWTSSQYNKYYAWSVHANGTVNDNNKFNKDKVRSIRTF